MKQDIQPDGGNVSYLALALSKTIPMEQQADCLIDAFQDMVDILHLAKEAGGYPPKDLVAQQLVNLAARAMISYESLMGEGDCWTKIAQHLRDLQKELERIGPQKMEGPTSRN